MYELIPWLITHILLDKQLRNQRARQWLGIIFFCFGAINILGPHHVSLCANSEIFWPVLFVMTGWHLFDTRDRWAESPSTSP